jgi:hypothetical protein
MKHLILLILICITTSASAQVTQQINNTVLIKNTIDKEKDQAYYLMKAKKQTTAWLVLLGSGVVLVGTGLLIGAGEDASFSDAEAGVILGALGLSSMITSLPFFISSRINKSKSKVELTAQRTSNLRGKGMTTVKGLTLTIPLGK